ncbi:MAG TPA: choice-of-anchor Q domain-containing protein [Sedimentisphaerales bacterium]|nr:choice-of-anchor Q domain-containing protein [Sedimentisphaerales bacterium]
MVRKAFLSIAAALFLSTVAPAQTTTLNITANGSGMMEIHGYTGAAMNYPFVIRFWMSTDVFMTSWESKLTASEPGVFEAIDYTVGSPWPADALVLDPPEYNGGLGWLAPSSSLIAYFVQWPLYYGHFADRLVHSLDMVAHLPAGLPPDKEYTISTYAPDGTYRSCWTGGDGSQPINDCFPESQVVVRVHHALAPSKAINPSPGDDATDVPLRPTLSWSDGGDATSYDVYLGTSLPLGPNEFMGNRQSTSFDPGTLVHNTHYYWRIDSKNAYGTTRGDVWHFRTAGPSSRNVVYVNAAATGANNGTSWRDAFTRLQDACIDYDNAEIWVAAGTYKPDRDRAHPNGSGDRTATFYIHKSHIFYGGFAGYETSLDQRDPVANVTILSGDLAGDDGPNFANYGENSYHVVTTAAVFTGLVGFTVTGGNANGSGYNATGGGMLIQNADPAKRVAVDDCIFTGNAAVYGGGLYNVNGSPYLTNCVFVGNSSSSVSGSGGRGGGVYNVNGNPILASCEFVGNRVSFTYTYGNYGGFGGGFYNGNGSPELINCVFVGNSVSATGYGNCGFGGAMYNYMGRPALTNCTLAGNRADNSNWSRGGGIYSTGDQPSLTNCIVWDNTVSDGGRDPQISGTATVTYSCVQGGWAGEGNISEDPRLLSIIGKNLRIRKGSPCIDAGDNGASGLVGITTDLDGRARYVDDPAAPDTGSGASPIADMGAYEYPADPAEVRFVNDDAPVGGDGRTWATAFKYLQSALADAQSSTAAAVTEIWVAGGIYKPDMGENQTAGNRSDAFQLLTGVAIRGGFAGTEDPATFDLTTRNFGINQTILSGDLAGDDGPNFVNNGENSHHVVVGYGTDPSAVLDGFTVKAGNASGSYGGGLYNVNGSPYLTNCVFVGNSSSSVSGSGGRGGGVYNVNGNPILASCEFVGNRVSFTYTYGNYGGFGGGFYNGNGSPELINCVFVGNSVSATGYGNCGFGGAMYNYMGRPALTNCTLAGNRADNSNWSRGGGIYSTGDQPSLTNCIVWDNTVSDGGRDPQISGTATVTYSCVQGGWAGEGNISEDPRLLSIIGKNLRIRKGSPCIDAGDNGASGLVGITTDLDGHPRFVDDPLTVDSGKGTPPIVDMGAYEFIQGDLDGDGDVDVADFGVFQSCFNGPNRPYRQTGCDDGDFDADGDVDRADFARFQSCFNGPNRPPKC